MRKQNLPVGIKIVKNSKCDPIFGHLGIPCGEAVDYIVRRSRFADVAAK